METKIVMWMSSASLSDRVDGATLLAMFGDILRMGMWIGQEEKMEYSWRRNDLHKFVRGGEDRGESHGR